MADLSAFSSRPYRFVVRTLAKYKLAHAIILCAVAGAVTCSVSTQYAVKYLVDALSDPSHHDAIWSAFIFVIALIAADNLLWRVAAWVGHSAFVSVSGSVRRDLFKHLTGHSPSFFLTQPPGSLTSRITATSNALYTSETLITFNALPPLIATFVAICYLATVSVTMAASLTALVAVVVTVMFRWAAQGKPLHRNYAEDAAAVDGEMIDIISNITLVKAFGRLKGEHRRLASVVSEETRSRRRSLYYLEKLRIFHALTTAALTCALLAWAIHLWQKGAASAGDVILVCTLGISILSATRDLAVALVDVTQHLARLSEALTKLLAPHSSTTRPLYSLPTAKASAISFRDVTFGYPNGKQLFTSLDLTIDAGSRVGIVGPSGGGKTTLFSLLQRFYVPKSGAVLINGRDIAGLTDEALRRSIAVVPQDVTLFHRSLRDNIRYGRPGATDEEVWNAAEMARCLGFIEQLPDGLDTIVGDRGARLSGGQRQRIAIARAFLKDSPILLLDEATSALDTQSEDLIREALATLMRGRTVVAIAHRLSTLSNFDRIVVMQSGQIIQDGPPDNLLAKAGTYKSLIDLEVRRLRGVDVAA
ncbi:ABC transporter ATP-binding protein [Hyphomicrobium sp.]|uniref:ABC transporter ATP-binding protein n=1 Tax=Hyphomicrobium sp. TaxID=82 RepID=UPI000FA286D5|nr:ABC transporter ATP-binding protein [Hyphomicrobium sp.]RUO98270.1 MAG: ABC transporter ATP-binding protein [Hyphomicrobium sp.]